MSAECSRCGGEGVVPGLIVGDGDSVDERCGWCKGLGMEPLTYRELLIGCGVLTKNIATDYAIDHGTIHAEASGRLADPITVGQRRHVVDLVIRVEVDADVADALLGGWPGSSGVVLGEHYVDPPVTGLDLTLGRAHEIACDVIKPYLMSLGLTPELSAPDGGVRFVETLDLSGSEF